MNQCTAIPTLFIPRDTYPKMKVDSGNLSRWGTSDLDVGKYFPPKPDTFAQRLQNLSRIALRLGKCLDRDCDYACYS